METVTLESILTMAGNVLTAALGWIGDVLEFVVTNPLAFILTVGLFLGGVGIAFTRRLIRL